MPRFDKLAATSAGSGFQYYDRQDFNFFKAGGIFLPKFVSSVSSTSQQFFLPKNRLGKALTSQIMYNVLINVDKSGLDLSFAANQYRILHGSIGDTVVTGSSGGFPIFYGYSISVSDQGDSIVFTLTLSNGSGVNDSTTQDLRFKGSVYLYLAPF